MGVPFLWIDTLCIFQDNLADWSTEARKMRDTYRGAFFNIAATGALNSTDGLFFQHSKDLLCPIEIDIAWLCDTTEASPQPKRCLVFPLDQWTESVEKSWLNNRGWVMQERFLSTRVMHFSKSQVFWECLELQSSEVFPEGIPWLMQPHWMDNPFELKRMANTSQASEDAAKMYDLWRQFRISYTRCQLTLPQDKLIAIQGIAQHFGDKLELDSTNDFVAGLWLPDIHRELCWSIDGHIQSSRAFPWRAPTWSWASVDGQIHPDSIRHHGECKQVSRQMALISIHHDKDKSGRLLRASLTIEGKILPAALLTEIDEIELMSKKTTVKLVTLAGRSDVPLTVGNMRQQTKHILETTLDIPEGIAAAGTVEHVFMLPVLRCPHKPKPRASVHQDGESEESYLSGLILRQSSQNNFKRIGHFQATGNGHDFLFHNLPISVQVVTLI